MLNSYPEGTGTERTHGAREALRRADDLRCRELVLMRSQHQPLIWVFPFKYIVLDAEHQLLPIKGAKSWLQMVLTNISV